LRSYLIDGFKDEAAKKIKTACGHHILKDGGFMTLRTPYVLKYQVSPKE